MELAEIEPSIPWLVVRQTDHATNAAMMTIRIIIIIVLYRWGGRCYPIHCDLF